MTRARFLAVASCQVEGGREGGSTRLRTEELTDLRLVFDAPRMKVFADESARITSLSDGAGIIIGDLFRRDGTVQSTQMDEKSTSEVLRSKGAHLIEAFWGEYVAFLARPDDVIMRDPSGAIPCYRTDIGGAIYFYSDIEILLRLRLLEPSIAWRELARALAYPSSRSADTCMAGVREVMPGCGCSRAAQSWSDVEFWSPWDFARPEVQFADRRDTIVRLREEIRTATAGWAGLSGAPLLELSGGIDSSIVAVCLAEAGVQPVCTNLVSPYPGEDERRYAELAASHIASPLHVVTLRPGEVDIMDVSSDLSCRPADHPLKRIIDLAFAREGSRCGADCFFSGSGGDYVLGYLRTSAPAADVLRTFGFGAHFLSTSADVARLHRETTWKVTRLAIKKALSRSVFASLPPPAPFLSSDARNIAPAIHPWARERQGALPGKAEQIAMLASGQGVRDGRDRGGLGPNRVPLLAQPVVETCLRTPSWMTVAGGRNRAVARDAFSGELPDAIINRRSKADFSGLISAIFECNRPLLQELLLDGLLAAQGIVDRAALENYLRCARAPTDLSFTQALHLASVELWAQSWRNRSMNVQTH